MTEEKKRGKGEIEKSGRSPTDEMKTKEEREKENNEKEENKEEEEKEEANFRQTKQKSPPKKMQTEGGRGGR